MNIATTKKKKNTQFIGNNNTFDALKHLDMQN